MIPLRYLFGLVGLWGLMSSSVQAQLTLPGGFQQGVERRRQVEISYLINTISTERYTMRSRIDAMGILGEMRAQEACSALAKWIHYEDPHAARGPHSLAGYPAAAALIQIGGKSAYIAILGRTHDKLTDQEISNLARMIGIMDGKELGVFRITQWQESYEAKMTDSAVDAQRIRNLKEMIRVLKAATDVP